MLIVVVLTLWLSIVLLLRLSVARAMGISKLLGPISGLSSSSSGYVDLS